MNFYGPENRPEHTIAGRLIPLAGALYQAVMKAAGRSTPALNHSANFPAWGHRICNELTKSIFRNLVEAVPAKDSFDARKYGRIVGMLLRGASFWFKEAPAQLKSDGLSNLTTKQEEKLEEMAGLELLFPAASERFQKLITNEDELFEAGQAQLEAKIEVLLSQALVVMKFLVNQPVAEQHKFLCGIPEGFITVINPSGEFAGKRNRYEIYLLLLMNWPEIVEMQQAQPPKTRRDLLDWLEKQEKRQLFEDPKAFFELCGDIGLELAPPGHPSKARRH